MDVQSIDFLCLHNPDADGRSSFLKKGESLLALPGGKFFGIIDSRQPDPGRQNNSGGHDRTGQRTSPGFIQSGHELKTFGADFLFKGVHASLRLIERLLSAERSFD
jgi:hypothetical protein